MKDIIKIKILWFLPVIAAIITGNVAWALTRGNPLSGWICLTCGLVAFALVFVFCCRVDHYVWTREEKKSREKQPQNSKYSHEKWQEIKRGIYEKKGG
jgi:tellurite resistance protein TehA-like permease